MKPIKIISLAVLILTTTACHDKPTVEELKKFAATEIYPEDTYLDSVTNKRALIIVAHDDDDCIMSGTIAKLTANGWTIKQLSFEVHNTPGENRNAAHIICEGSEKILEDGLYRPGVDTIKYSYHTISYGEIEKQYLYEKERDKWLIPRMEKWGYPQTGPTADEILGIDGIPVPDVQINITDQAETKMTYLRTYPENVRKNFRKYIPYYEEFDAKLYFSIFDREFFRIIEK